MKGLPSREIAMEVLRNLRSRLRLVVGLGVAAVPGLGQEPPAGLLDELLNVKVEIATKRAQRQEEAPSIVSVVTRADIERYGWRELGEILRALPGFDFGNDGTALIGLAERGIWAHEGKALLLVDGVMVSPLHNDNINYPGSYPAELIDRVEVIRGPGSAVYGQFAGTAVIHIHTRAVTDPEGGRFVIQGTTLTAGNSGGGGYLAANGKFLNDVSVSFSAGFRTEPFSNQAYVDTLLTGASFDQTKGSTRRENSYITGAVRARGTEVHFVRHTFQAAQVDGGGTGITDPGIPGLPFGVLASGSRYIQGVKALHTFDLAENWALDASLEELQNTGGSIYPQSPGSSGVNHSGTERSRFTADLGLRWTLPFRANLLVGGGAIRDWERSVDLQNRGALRDPLDPTLRLAQQTLGTRFGYAQYTQSLRAGEVDFGLTAGARYETNHIGHAFAPRLGLTFVWSDFNAKLLYGEAFRAPTLFQTYSTFFAFRGYLKPEIIKSLELELGWRILPVLQGRVNFYRIRVTDAISSALDNYNYYIINSGENRSRGVEASLDLRAGDWGGFANISYTEPDGKGDPFFLSADGKSFLGLTPLKVNVGGFLRQGPIQVAPSLLYCSSRQTQTARSAQSGIGPNSLMPLIVETQASPARLLLNLTVGWKNLLGKDTEARFTGNNLTNTRFPVLQPYYGDHAPLPANDRRFTLDLVWRF
jgi:hypothetical protein